MRGVKENLIGKKFGHLTVVQRGPNAKNGETQWYCQCDCGNPNLVLARTYMLNNGRKISCGCVSKKSINKNKKYKKTNLIDMESQEYAIGYTSKGEPFWFDKEDIEIVKQYYWHYNNRGYLVNKTDKTILLHRLIMGVTDPNLMVDHIDHPYGTGLKIDNRKQNLRIVNRVQNFMNRHITPNNKTGVKGVCFDTKRKKWLAHLRINKKTILFKRFDTFNEAVKARKEAEEKYCGEYAFRDNANSNNHEIKKED